MSRQTTLKRRGFLLGAGAALLSTTALVPLPIGTRSDTMFATWDGVRWAPEIERRLFIMTPADYAALWRPLVTTGIAIYRDTPKLEVVDFGTFYAVEEKHE